MNDAGIIESLSEQDVSPIAMDRAASVGVYLRLYVGRLPYRTSERDLEDLFGQFGEVQSATVITDRDTGRSKGFGFVDMSDDQAAQNAINQLNNSVLDGRTIVVNEAQERRDNRSGGNSYQRRNPRY